MTITETLKTARRELCGIDSAAIDVYVMLGHLLECGRNDLYVRGNEPLGDEIVNRYFEMVERRKTHEPVQYIVNQCEFMSLDFYVDKNVLIPRPETETLVEAVMAEFKSGRGSGLDLCAGSGCVAVSIAHYCPGIEMTVSDISKQAVKIAKLNAADNGVGNRMDFVQSDLFEKFDDTAVRFDFIVSNPPYIKTAAIEQLGENVRKFEPRTALDGGADGLDFYREIAGEAKRFLKPNAPIFFEIGAGQAAAVMRILKDEGFEELTVFKDLMGLVRVVRAH